MTLYLSHPVQFSADTSENVPSGQSLRVAGWVIAEHKKLACVYVEDMGHILIKDAVQDGPVQFVDSPRANVPALHAEQVVDAIARFVLEPGGQTMHTSAIAVGANLAEKTNTGHFVMMMAPTHVGKEEK